VEKSRKVKGRFAPATAFGSPHFSLPLPPGPSPTMLPSILLPPATIELSALSLLASGARDCGPRMRMRHPWPPPPSHHQHRLVKEPPTVVLVRPRAAVGAALVVVTLVALVSVVVAIVARPGSGGGTRPAIVTAIVVVVVVVVVVVAATAGAARGSVIVAMSLPRRPRAGRQHCRRR
jgi:hypothetical protein